MFQNEPVNAVMTQIFLTGMRNWNTGVSIGMRSKFLIRRRDNHTSGVTLGSYTGVKTKAWLDGPSIPSESEKPNFRLPFITSGMSGFPLR